MIDHLKLSFELNEEMLDLIGREFEIEKLVNRFLQGISGKKGVELEKFAAEIFSRYGVDWMKKSLQLGEEYLDRTYEVLREAIDTTGGHLWFPLLPQRFLEIAYLSVHDEMELLPVYENNSRRLVYRIIDCKMFRRLQEECGDKVTKILPCRHACLSACSTLFNDLEFPEVQTRMRSSTNKDGYCEFVIQKL